jgi:mannitol-specific phosphotransferase system IIBC component
MKWLEHKIERGWEILVGLVAMFLIGLIFFILPALIVLHFIVKFW